MGEKKYQLTFLLRKIQNRLKIYNFRKNGIRKLWSTASESRKENRKNQTKSVDVENNGKCELVKLLSVSHQTKKIIKQTPVYIVYSR